MSACDDLMTNLREAARNVVLSYQEANPMRTADMHHATCGCLRCEIDRLEYALDRMDQGGEGET